MARLEAFYKNVIAPRLAKIVVEEMRQILSVQAPLMVVGGRVVAATPATPGAPPRRVTGALKRSVRARGNRIYIGKFYGWVLDKTGHPFIQKSIKAALKRSRSSNARVK